VDLFYGKASVRLVRNGQIMRNLPVVGGPVVVGQTVSVDFTTTMPTVVATGTEGLSLDDVRDLLASSDALGEAALTQITITLFSGGSVKAMYTPSADGLETAIQEANSGDVIFLPDIDIEGDFALQDGVNLSGVSSRESIIRGTLTMADDCLISNLHVRKCADSASDIVAVVGSPETGIIRNCEIHCYQCGDGDAIAISVLSTAVTLSVEQSTVKANSADGAGYAFSNAGGVCYVTGCILYAKTELFRETV
jgi:hypothetical protein